MTTKSNEIFQESRNIAINVLQKLFTNLDSSPEHCTIVEYELSCWIDGLTMDMLDSFSNLIQDALSYSSMSIIIVAQGWKESKLPGPVPTLLFTPLLIQAIRNIQQASKSFNIFICQVTVHCMLFMTNPLPLASLILMVSNSSSQGEQFDSVTTYARKLVNMQSLVENDRITSLQLLLEKTFGENSLILIEVIQSVSSPIFSSTKIMSYLNNKKVNYIELIRQIYHLISMIDGSDLRVNCMDLIYKLLPIAIKVNTNGYI